MDNHFTLSKALEYSNTVIKHSSCEIYCSYDEKIDDKMKQSELYKAFSTHKTQYSNMKDCLAYVYLSFQRNRLLHYCFQSAVLLHCIDINGHYNDKVLQKQKIKQDFIFLCELFKAEFIFDPDVSREQVISWNTSVIRQQGESQNGYFKKTKHAEFYQGVRNVRFWENLTCFVFLKHPFWDLPFCLITNE